MTKRLNEYENEDRQSSKRHLNNESKVVEKPKGVWDADQKGRLENFIHNPDMLAALRKKGIRNLFPIQYKTFDHVYKGEDLIARDRTGSGKTLAFALPVLQRFYKEGLNKNASGRCKFLIILPTRELAIQVGREIDSLSQNGNQWFKTVAVYGGSSVKEQTDKVQLGCDILVGTPGRLIDFINRGVIHLDELRVFCLDEADEMLNQGFKQDIENIFESITKKVKDKPQVMMFSATIPEWIHEMSEKYQAPTKQFVDLIGNEGAETATSKTVVHLKMSCERLAKEDAIFDLIDHFCKKKWNHPEQGRVLIFCETKRDANRIGNTVNAGMQKGVLHGDIPQMNRERVFRDFRTGSLKCVVATNVAARGLDFPEIALIIQFEPPKNTDSYVHRSGRTGRAGKSGTCITLYSSREARLFQRIEEEARIQINEFDFDSPRKNIRAAYQTWSDTVSDSETKKAFERKGELELFIGGIENTQSEDDIKSFFVGNFVRVVNFKLLKDPQGESKGVGFLLCANDDEKTRAMELDGSKLGTKKLRISPTNGG